MRDFEEIMDREVILKQTVIGSERASYVAQLEDFYYEVAQMVSREREFRMFLFIYPMIVMLRLFKTFNAQPRLGIVTRTLSSSANDMMHFLLVFLTIFISFIVSGTVLFGQDLDDFATWDRSLVTCFRCMMGDFDFDAMETVG